MPVKREQSPLTPAGIERPVTFYHPCGGLMMSPSALTLPCAYYSPERRGIYVDPQFRDRVVRAMRATVSPSGIWTFRLKGDEKEAQEHTEVIPYYDPATGPQKGDTQVFPDRKCMAVTYKYDCVRLVGGGSPEWICREPLTIGRCHQPARQECFETWDIVGKSNIYSDPDCKHLARVADLWGWSCLEL